MKRVVFLIDMQSFYVSVEKVFYPKLEHKPVVVAGDPERRSGVILAACPIAKNYGIKTAETLGEAQSKCENLCVIKPRMQLYIEVSIKINELLLTYTPLVEPFSIDESFVDLTGTVHQAKPEQTAERIQREIERHFGIYARFGIGENKILAKSACDLQAKKRKGGIFTLYKANLEQDFWQFPIEELFGVGSRMEKHFRQTGIRKIGHLARYPVEELQKRWGINGELLWQHANGIDPSPVNPDSHQEKKSVGHGMTLPRDYTQRNDILIVVRELAEEVAQRTRSERLIGHQVSMRVRGTYDVPAGFSRQRMLDMPTNDGKVIYQACKTLFDRYWPHTPIRSIGISLEKVEPDTHRQLSLFDEIEDRQELNQTVDLLKNRFGTHIIMYASSLTHAGQIQERAKKIGGHYK